jgi:nitroreductase/NAD-dependent dihydropyrimidine dehydrogenase PreA subunit
MATLDFTVRADRCDRCGLCAADCPARIIEQDAGGLPLVPADKVPDCLECQHCLAVCPTAAISVFGLDPGGSLPVSAEVWPRAEQMGHLVRGRRSVRRYRDEDVDAALISRLLAAAANAPTGVNNRSLVFTVIDEKAKLQRFREAVMAALVAASKAGRIPARFAYIEKAVAAYVEHGADVVFRGAPHVLIVSAPPHAPCATEDVPIALAYFELLAQSAGLGTVWCGLLKLALEALPQLKSLVGLAPDRHYYPMLFGYPAIRYARTVQRDSAATVQRPSIGMAPSSRVP